MLSFVHTGVFVPVSERDPVPTKFTFSPLNNPSMRLTYWDEEAYLSELVLTTEDTPFSQQLKEGSHSTTTGKPAGTNATGEDGVAKETKNNDKTKKRKAETGTTTSNKMVSSVATDSRGGLNVLNRMSPPT